MERADGEWCERKGESERRGRGRGRGGRAPPPPSRADRSLSPPSPAPDMRPRPVSLSLSLSPSHSLCLSALSLSHLGRPLRQLLAPRGRGELAKDAGRLDRGRQGGLLGRPGQVVDLKVGQGQALEVHLAADLAGRVDEGLRERVCGAEAGGGGGGVREMGRPGRRRGEECVSVEKSSEGPGAAIRDPRRPQGE